MAAEDHYGQTSTEGIRIFLKFWPKFQSEYEEACQLVLEEDLLFTEETINFSWYHLYELPLKDYYSELFKGYLQDEKFLAIFQRLVSSGDQAKFLPEVIKDVNSYFSDMPPPDEEARKLIMPLLPSILGKGLSAYHSLRCVLYHGCFLNELIDRVRNGDDKALFDAIRIDPTVIGCKSVIQRVSKAAMLQDHKFFKKLKAAINGKIAKREQSHYQKMRLVFEVLHEAKAERLTDQQLYQLFVEELALYHWDAKEGGNAKALRKFADTYMKQYSTT